MIFRVVFCVSGVSRRDTDWERLTTVCRNSHIDSVSEYLEGVWDPESFKISISYEFSVLVKAFKEVIFVAAVLYGYLFLVSPISEFFCWITTVCNIMEGFLDRSVNSCMLQYL